AKLFAERSAAGGDLRHQAVHPLTDLADVFLAFGNGTGVHVHVGLHVAIGSRVGGDLDHGNGREADSAAAAGGEDDDVDTAGREGGERHRVVAGSVHVDEAGPGDALGVFDHVGERRGSALDGGAEGFFRNVG